MVTSRRLPLTAPLVAYWRRASREAASIGRMAQQNSACRLALRGCMRAADLELARLTRVIRLASVAECGLENNVMTGVACCEIWKLRAL